MNFFILRHQVEMSSSLIPPPKVRLASIKSKPTSLAKCLFLDDKSAMRYPICDSTTPDNMEFDRQSHTSKEESYSSEAEEPPCGADEETSSSQSIGTVVVGPCKKMGVKRVYDKRHYCLYCSKPYAKMARHLEHAHEDKSDVARALSS